jgi:hypothetical protein
MHGSCTTYTILNVYYSELEPLNEQVYYRQMEVRGIVRVQRTYQSSPHEGIVFTDELSLLVAGILDKVPALEDKFENANSLLVRLVCPRIPV